MGHAGQMRERWSDYKAYVRGGLICKFDYCLRQGDTFGNGGVHLPVAGYDFLSHILLVFIGFSIRQIYVFLKRFPIKYLTLPS